MADVIAICFLGLEYLSIIFAIHYLGIEIPVGIVAGMFLALATVGIVYWHKKKILARSTGVAKTHSPIGRIWDSLMGDRFTI
jgi:hypothetical protein